MKLLHTAPVQHGYNEVRSYMVKLNSSSNQELQTRKFAIIYMWAHTWRQFDLRLAAKIKDTFRNRALKWMDFTKLFKPDLLREQRNIMFSYSQRCRKKSGSSIIRPQRRSLTPAFVEWAHQSP